MGDIIHALPVLDYLHKVVPGVEIDWIVEEAFSSLLEGHPQISRLIVVRTKAWRRAPFAAATRGEIAALKAKLREVSYKFVFDIQGNLKSGLLAWLSGCEQRIGFDESELQERYNRLFTTRRIPVRASDRHVTDKCLRLVSVPFGRDFNGMELVTTLATSKDDDYEADALMSTLGDGLVFLFHYGTTWQTKFWTPSGWIELGKQMLSSYPDSTILFSWGSDEERAPVIEIARGIGQGARVMDRYPLKKFVAFLKKVDLVIGADTGPVHLAAAVGTPTVSFYRASDGRRSGPRGALHGIIQAPMPCARCFRTKCDKDSECRNSITAQMIADEVARLIPPAFASAVAGSMTGE